MGNKQARRRRLALAGIWLATVAAAAPQSVHRPARRSALHSHAYVAGITPAEYRAAFGPVKTCADFFRRMPSLPQTRTLLRGLFVGGIPERPAGETADAFIGRMLHRLFDRLGDPTRIYTDTPLDSAARYDPATETMTIDLGRPPVLGVIEQRTLISRASAGGTLHVQTELQAALDFTPATLPPSLALRMNPEEAARFKAGGGRLRVLSLFEDYGMDSRPATTGRAPTSYQLVRLKPRCAMFADRGRPLGDWRLDAWTAEPLPGG